MCTTCGCNIHVDVWPERDRKGIWKYGTYSVGIFVGGL